MFCVNCGKENDDGVVFCSNCGRPPKGVAVQRNTFPLTNFTAFAIFMVIMFSDDPYGGFVLWAIASIVGAFGLYKLIKWKRSGFWINGIFWFIFVGRFLIDGFEAQIIGSLLIAAVFMAILFGVLQLKNSDNKSTWKQLE